MKRPRVVEGMGLSGMGEVLESQGVLRVATALGENAEKGNFIFRTSGLRDLEQVLWTENCWRRNRRKNPVAMVYIEVTLAPTSPIRSEVGPSVEATQCSASLFLAELQLYSPSACMTRHSWPRPNPSFLVLIATQWSIVQCPLALGLRPAEEEEENNLWTLDEKLLATARESPACRFHTLAPLVRSTNPA